MLEFLLRCTNPLLLLVPTFMLLTACQLAAAPTGGPDATEPTDVRFEALIAENEAFIDTIKAMRDDGYVMYLLLPTVGPLVSASGQAASAPDWWKDCMGMPTISVEGLQTLVQIGYAMQRLWPTFSEIRIGETCASLDAVTSLNIPAKPVMLSALNPVELQRLLGQTDEQIRTNAVNALIRRPSEFGNVLTIGWSLPLTIPSRPRARNAPGPGDAVLFKAKPDGLEFVRVIEQRLWMPYARRALVGTNLPRAETNETAPK